MKFRLNKIFLREIPPVKNDDTVIERIRIFNILLNNEYHDNPAIAKFSLHERLCALSNSNNPFFDHIHFNYKYVLPFSLLSRILKYSNNVPRKQLMQKISFGIIRDHTIIRETSTDEYPFVQC